MKFKKGNVSTFNAMIQKLGYLGLISLGLGALVLVQPTNFGEAATAIALVIVGVFISFFNGIVALETVRQGYKHFVKEQEAERATPHRWLGLYSAFLMLSIISLGRYMIGWYQTNPFQFLDIFWVLLVLAAFFIAFFIFIFNLTQWGKLDSEIAAYNLLQREQEMKKKNDTPKEDDEEEEEETPPDKLEAQS